MTRENEVTKIMVTLYLHQIVDCETDLENNKEKVKLSGGLIKRSLQRNVGSVINHRPYFSVVEVEQRNSELGAEVLSVHSESTLILTPYCSGTGSIILGEDIYQLASNFRKKDTKDTVGITEKEFKNSSSNTFRKHLKHLSNALSLKRKTANEDKYYSDGSSLVSEANKSIFQSIIKKIKS